MRIGLGMGRRSGNGRSKELCTESGNEDGMFEKSFIWDAMR